LNPNWGRSDYTNLNGLFLRPVFCFVFRLAKAYDDLKAYLENEKELEENEVFATAKTILDDAKVHLPQKYQ
jgi:hypothetical protein